jgi:hypothetical protein
MSKKGRSWNLQVILETAVAELANTQTEVRENGSYYNSSIHFNFEKEKLLQNVFSGLGPQNRIIALFSCVVLLPTFKV